MTHRPAVSLTCNRYALNGWRRRNETSSANVKPATRPSIRGSCAQGFDSADGVYHVPLRTARLRHPNMQLGNRVTDADAINVGPHDSRLTSAIRQCLLGRSESARRDKRTSNSGKLGRDTATWPDTPIAGSSHRFLSVNLTASRTVAVTTDHFDHECSGCAHVVGQFGTTPKRCGHVEDADTAR